MGSAAHKVGFREHFTNGERRGTLVGPDGWSSGWVLKESFPARR